MKSSTNKQSVHFKLHMVLSSAMRSHQTWGTSNTMYNPMRTGPSLFPSTNIWIWQTVWICHQGFPTICVFFRCFEKKLNTVKYFNKQNHLEFFEDDLTMPLPLYFLVVIFFTAFKLFSVWHRSVAYFMVVASKIQINLAVSIFFS